MNDPFIFFFFCFMPFFIFSFTWYFQQDVIILYNRNKIRYKIIVSTEYVRSNTDSRQLDAKRIKQRYASKLYTQ